MRGRTFHPSLLGLSVIPSPNRFSDPLLLLLLVPLLLLPRRDVAIYPALFNDGEKNLNGKSRTRIRLDVSWQGGQARKEGSERER